MILRTVEQTVFAEKTGAGNTRLSPLLGANLSFSASIADKLLTLLKGRAKTQQLYVVDRQGKITHMWVKPTR